MKINFSNWSINQKLALFAFLLGLTAVFMHDPLKSKLVTVDLNELTLIVKDKSANVNVEELAHWLIEKKTDFILIDLRDAVKYNEYSIPGAINLSPADINSINYPKIQKIIIYSDDVLQSGQAWFVLKSKNYKGVYLLSGGISEWNDKILFPGISADAAPEEKAKFAIAVEISKYFGGSPRMNSVDKPAAMPQPAMPKFKAPAVPAMQKGKKKREGC